MGRKEDIIKKVCESHEFQETMKAASPDEQKQVEMALGTYVGSLVEGLLEPVERIMKDDEAREKFMAALRGEQIKNDDGDEGESCDS